MSSIGIDAAAVRDEQRAIWDAVSWGWQRWQAEFERGAASVTALLLELGGVGPGQSLLDVGTGIGEPALTAAQWVAPRGRVLGIDPSPAMIAAARSRAANAGNVDFAEGDVETVPLPARSFDVALSRWALMFAADRVATLRALASLLKPGGVLAAAVWGPPRAAPMISLAFGVISERLSLEPPPRDLPGPFSMSDPAQVTAELAAAGFSDVEVQEHVVPFRLDSVTDFIGFARDVLPPRMKQLLRDRCGSVDDPGVWEAFAQAAERYVTADGGVSLPSISLCIRAVTGGGA
jgi:SAM-dependent methyltransferase